MIPQSHFQWFLCALYTVLLDSFGGFDFFMYIVQSRQSARLFLSRLNWDSPGPSTAGECFSIPPSFGSGGGGGAHSLAGEGYTLRS